VTVPKNGIPTEYAGTTFRSRLEARWARFFDAIGWSWEYEPFDADGYIPDFLILGRSSLLIEIKPYGDITALATEARRVKPLVGLGWSGHFAVFGASPFLQLDGSWCEQGPGVYVAGGSDWGSPPEKSALGWVTCSYESPYGAAGPKPCDKISVFHQEDAYQAIPCGHHDGDHHLHGGFPLAYLSALWAAGRDATKWPA
jgi:hypothetical protein